MLLSGTLSLTLWGCADFTGPTLTKVISTTCGNEIKFNNFRNCINRNWHDQVVAQGYGADPLAQQFNSRMRLLSEAVAQRQISDIDAISNAMNLAYQLKTVEAAQIDSQNEALLRNLSRAASVPQSSNPARTTSNIPQAVSCTKIGDFSGRVYSFRGIACPAGYAP